MARPQLGQLPGTPTTIAFGASADPGTTGANAALADHTHGMFDESSIDHGGLGGLSHDDHTQYLLADGSRNLSGDITFDSGVDITFAVDSTSSIGTTASRAAAVYADTTTTRAFVADGRTSYLGTSGTFNNVSTTDVSFFDLEGSAAVTITGFANGTSGKVIYVRNTGAYDCVLEHNSTSSSVGNRMLLPSGLDIVLAATKNEQVVLTYEPENDAWVACAPREGDVVLVTDNPGLSVSTSVNYSIPSPPPRYITLILNGPGGGGGGCPSTGSGEQSAAGGGGGGGYCVTKLGREDFPTSAITGTVYGGGSGGSTSGTSGSNGQGNSTISATGLTTMTANAGSGGEGGGVASNSRNEGGAGGAASGGNVLNSSGQGGGLGAVIGNQRVPNGYGGSCGPFGGPRAANGAAGNNAASLGCGGGGASNSPNSSGKAGGGGENGQLTIIEEY